MTSVLCSSPSAPMLTSFTIQATLSLPHRENGLEGTLSDSHPQSRGSPLVGGDRQQRIFLNVIRLLANELELPLVCAGTPEARRALLTDSGLADRFESVELPRWTNNLAFRRLLASYAAILPLRQRSELEDDKVRAAVLKLSEGITVRVVRLLERLAVEAIRNGAERITLESFARTRSPRPCCLWNSCAGRNNRGGPRRRLEGGAGHLPARRSLAGRAAERGRRDGHLSARSNG
jgi:Bacterial TniB protein